MIKDFEISNFSHMISLVTNPEYVGLTFFRGVSKINYQLIPSIGRDIVREIVKHHIDTLPKNWN
jgi:hypothetical protein